MKKLVLHIGMAKTGTSSIQDTLGHGADQLREQGVHYAPWKPFNHSFKFSVLFLRNPQKSFYYKQLSPITDEAWAQELQRLRDLWQQLFASFEHGTCVVSAENLGRLSAEEIASLKEFVSPWFDEIRVVAYVRKPLQALKSQWEQDVKELREPLSGAEVLARTKRRLTYRFFERWIDAFSREDFVLRRFDPATFVGGNLLSDFFHAAEITLNETLELPAMESNQSLGAEGTALLLAMNARYPLYTESGSNQKRGMVRRQHLFYKAMRQSGASPLDFEVRFTASEAEPFNRKIRFLNSLLPQCDHFDEVAASGETTTLPDPSVIPADYAVELINHLSQLVDEMADRTDHLQSTKPKLLDKLKRKS
ncbi:MAG: hypothetical protein V7720_02195 [Halioglobus sp.]